MSAVSRASRPRLAAKARLKWDRHENKHMLLYPERGLVLNASAAAILELCDGERTVEDIARAIAARTEKTTETPEATPESILADVVAFVETMHGKGLLTTGEP